MTAFLARLDRLLIRALSGDAFTDFLIWLADRAIAVEDRVSKLETRWNSRVDQRTPPMAPGRHRRVGRGKTWDQDIRARDDYEWGMAIKVMASRMDGKWATWQ